MRSLRVSVPTVELLRSRVSRKCRQAVMPSLWGMLVSRKQRSRVTRRALGGSCPSCSSLLRKCVVSFMNDIDCVVCTRGLRWWSTNCDIVVEPRSTSDIEILFKLIVKVSVVGITADTPNPTGAKFSLARGDSQISFKRVAT